MWRRKAAAKDRELLDQSIRRLRATGVIEYTGEFGNEIATFIPFAFWLKTQGLLVDRRVVTYRGMKPYYYFLEDNEFAEKAGARQWLPVERRDWPTNSTYTATKQPWHVIPDYRSRYRSAGREFSRPILFIQNKFTVEWEIGPINFLSLTALERLFGFSTDRFDVIYSRPDARLKEIGYTNNHNISCDYPDRELVERFDNVTVLEDLCPESGASYNLTKLEILAKSHLFVAVQGGGAHLLACFGNSLLLLQHNKGYEHPHAYSSGAYKYLSNPPPRLLLARGHEQFAEAVDVIDGIWLKNDSLWLDPGMRSTFQALSV